MKITLLDGLVIGLIGSIIVLGVGVYYWTTKDSRAIEYYKARLQPSEVNSSSTSNADEDALVKLGWLVRRNIHLNHQTIKTNAAREFYEIARAMGVQLKEPIFFSIIRPDPAKPADIKFTAYREDVPAVEKVLAQLDSATQQ